MKLNTQRKVAAYLAEFAKLSAVLQTLWYIYTCDRDMEENFSRNLVIVRGDKL
jgi:hypothetical protein